MTARNAPEQPPIRDFVFVGGSLALDLVNTEINVRGKPRDLLALPDDVVGWWQHAQGRYPEGDMVQFNGSLPPADVEFLAATKALRATLRRIFSAVDAQQSIRSEDLEHLNAVLRLADLAVDRGTDGVVRSVYRTVNSLDGAVLLPVALSAKQLLTEGNLSRVHHCRNQRCILFFYDDTRSATRHWCSVGCMNRARSSQRYQAEKQRRAG